MRRWQPWVMFGVGLLLGAGGVLSQLKRVPGPHGFMVWRARGFSAEYFPPIAVAVACDDVRAGTVLKKDQVCERRIPEGFVQTATLRPEQAASVIGLTVRKPLEAAEPLQAAFFAEPGPDRAGLAPPGH
jgi:Flp pilus assembly protein CpaB